MSLDNKTEALEIDNAKLVIQIQAELAEKNYIKKQLDTANFLISLSKSKIATLEEALNLAHEQYECLAISGSREL